MKASAPFWSFVLLVAIASAAFAQSYPTKPIRMIIPFSAGGATDVVIRIVVAKLPDALGEQVVIDNRTGAGGLIGTEIAAKSNPDGYTLLATGTPHVIIPNLYKKVPFDPLKDFAPIMQVGSQPYGLTVHPSLGVKSVKELIDLAKKNPGKINYASSGNGGAQHLFQAMFVSMANLNMVHIPYKGNSPARALARSLMTTRGIWVKTASVAAILAGCTSNPAPVESREPRASAQARPSRIAARSRGPPRPTLRRPRARSRSGMAASD